MGSWGRVLTYRNFFLKIFFSVEPKGTRGRGGGGGFRPIEIFFKFFSFSGTKGNMESSPIENATRFKIVYTRNRFASKIRTIPNVSIVARPIFATDPKKFSTIFKIFSSFFYSVFHSFFISSLKLLLINGHFFLFGDYFYFFIYFFIAFYFIFQFFYFFNFFPLARNFNFLNFFFNLKEKKFFGSFARWKFDWLIEIFKWFYFDFIQNYILNHFFVVAEIFLHKESGEGFVKDL